MTDPRDEALRLLNAQRFAEALPLFLQATREDPSSWSDWHMAGQCCRFTGDLTGAVANLQRAAELKPDEAPVLLALGIAFQLSGNLSASVERLEDACRADADYALAYNSLGVTLRKMGEVERAVEVYEWGLNALSRSIVNRFLNDRKSRIVPTRTTSATLWLGQATDAALHLCSRNPNVQTFAWPTGEQALEEERTRRHEGLYWSDSPKADGKLIRLFLPNYFNTFHAALRRDSAYGNLVGNRSVVLRALGRLEEAEEHEREATEFLPS